MSSYQITVNNKSAVQKNFFIFSAAPTVGGNKVFQNVFLSDTIAGGGNTIFSFERSLYAVCGKAVLQNGARLTQSFPSTALTLGTPTSKGTTLSFQVSSGAVSFVTPYPTPNAGPGDFNIKTGTDFNQGDPYFLGMGNKSDDSSEILPVASVAASPNATFEFTPHIIYYVATGNYAAGTIFDVTTVGATKEIPFTDGTFQATATYELDPAVAAQPETTDEILPVASIVASPNATFDFTPHITYYVATGNFAAGTIFDVTTVGATKAIPFDDGTFEGTAAYNPNGTWS